MPLIVDQLLAAGFILINTQQQRVSLPFKPGQGYFSLVENQNDLELDFKVFSLLILVVQTLYLMNPTDATLASLSVLKY